MRVVVAVDQPRGGAVVAELARDGVDVAERVDAASAASAASGQDGGTAEILTRADALVLQVERATLTARLVGLCDRYGIRIVPLGEGADAERLAASFGLSQPLPFDVEGWRLADALGSAADVTIPARGDAGPERERPQVVTVWGPAGAPGRSTVAVELAVELARGGRRAALVDADTHAPSIALALGLADEGPGFAAACRQVDLGTLDARELTRIALPLGHGGVEVLTGLNRPSRWPELSGARVTGALEACRSWVPFTVVDVAAPLERDEEIVSDLDGPRRNAATIAALQAADLVVAVAAADPVGVARFLRGYPELRAIVGATRIAVVANRLRPGTLGVDARGQVRRTLDRFGGIEDVWFLPADARSADVAILAARPIGEVAARSPFAAAIRRFVGEAVAPVPARSRSSRRERSARADPDRIRPRSSTRTRS